MSGRDAVVVDAVRTPVGRRGGGLSGQHPVDLSAHVLDALVARTGLDPALVEDVIWGCVSQTGEQAVNVGRNAALAAGWPEDVVGVTLDRQCGSSQQAVHFAAAGVIAGQYDIAVAGGVESMSRVPMLCTVTQGPGEPFGPRMLARYDGVGGLVPQGVSAEIIAERWGLSRTDLDEIAVRSHANAAAATDAGAFGAELAPVGAVDADEGIRRDSSLASLAGLRTVFREDGVVTAGNASQISDGAAALLVTTSEVAARHGWRPLARLHAFATAGVDPVTMLTAPIPATGAGPRAGRARPGRHRRVRGQRGVRLGRRRLAGRDRGRPRPGQPARRGDRPRPPARRLGGPADDHPGAPPAADRRPLGPADHVRGRRDGQRHRPGAALRLFRPRPAGCPHWGQRVWMTYTRVFPQVSGQSTGSVPIYFQRVAKPKPTMIKPKPMAMFHSPMDSIGYSVWVT